ncbi:hypothetical protein ACHAWF_004726 [Thalassiosira exigua]
MDPPRRRDRAWEARPAVAVAVAMGSGGRRRRTRGETSPPLLAVAPVVSVVVVATAAAGTPSAARSVRFPRRSAFLAPPRSRSPLPPRGSGRIGLPSEPLDRGADRPRSTLRRRPRSPLRSAPSGNGRGDRDDGPSLEEALAAATYLERRLDAVPADDRARARLGERLTSIACGLLDLGAPSRAAELFERVLEVEPDDVAVRERLSAARRMAGDAAGGARELHRVIRTLEDGGGCDGATLSWLWLDLGHSIEEIAPLPGSGSEWDASILKEEEAPRVRLDIEDGGSSEGGETSAFDCYRRALAHDGGNGMAHKRLVDALDDEALEEFDRAAELMPEDIFCATHVHYGALCHATIDNKSMGALPMGKGAAASNLADLSQDPSSLKGDEGDLISLAEAFERDGAIVFPRLLDAEGRRSLSAAVDSAVSDESGAHDFTDETRANSCRVHMALPLEGDHASAIASLFRTIHPLLSRILRCSDEDVIPLPGAGFMRTSPGAEGQVHHHDLGSGGGGGPRCVSIQVQLTDTRPASGGDGGGTMGSLEVLPGSHRPDASNGAPSVIREAVKDPAPSKGVASIDVPPGSVTIYSSRL